MRHHRGRANRFELAALTAHGCQTGIDVGLAKGGAAKATVRGGCAARRVADPQLNPLKKSATPAPVTPSRMRCAVLPFAPSCDGSIGMNRLEEAPQPVT